MLKVKSARAVGSVAAAALLALLMAGLALWPAAVSRRRTRNRRRWRT